MDIVEAYLISDIIKEEKQDGSFLVNAIRMSNGMPQSELRNIIT